MATNTYVKIDPIKGESTDDAHTEWLEIDIWNISVDQPISGVSGTGGRSAARANFSSFTISKMVDKSTLDLNMFCASGRHIAKLELEQCQETGEKVCLFKIELENLMVQSVSLSGGGSERPMEAVAFTFDKISWTYTPVNDHGTAGTTVGPKNWDLKTNKGS